MRMALSRLYKSGLIECESRVKTTAQGNASRYKVYFVPEVFNSSETIAPSEVELSNELSNPRSNTPPVQELVQEPVQESKASESKDSGAVEPTAKQTPPLFSSSSEKTATSPTEQLTEPPTSEPLPHQEDLRLGARVALKKKRTLSGEVTSISDGVYTVTFDNGTMAWFYRDQLLKLE